MTPGSLTHAAQSLNRVKAFFGSLRTVLELLLALSVATVAVSLWSIVRPQQELEQLTLGGIVLALAIAATIRSRSRRHQITLGDLTLSLEMKYGAQTIAPLSAANADKDLPEEWRPLVDQEIKALKRYESVRVWALASSLLIPVAISFVTLPNAAPSFKLAFSEVTNVVSRLTRGATLRVVVGATGEGHDQKMTLASSKPVKIELLAQNLIEVEATGNFGKAAPVVALRKPDTDQKTVQDFQSFQMTPIREGATETDEITRYSISFAVSEPVDLFIPTLDASPLAHIQVRQLPIPKVKLSVTSDLEDPWPDDQPLGLRISVHAENPLQAVRLLIKSGQRVSKELVANVVAEDKTELTTEYRLVLETYVESDLAQVEIQAEAVDRATPQPLVGHSDVLKLNTASAYGRYRATLQTLRELKTLVDEAVSKQDPKLPKEARELSTKAGDQSERSPFFDGLDRVQIHRFETRVQEVNGGEQGAEKVSELSQTLNDFLFEHEILDDRERDRDFFVAARGLSRLIEQDVNKRPVLLKTVADRMRKFLTDRQERWTKRVERLTAAYKPEKWPWVRDKKPFHEAVNQVEKLDEKAKTSPKAKSDELTALSKTVVDYRAWIEDLEAKEDKMRDEEEKQRQEGLASARDQLKELQKRQGEISAELDRAGERPKDDLESQWPATRMKENTNAKETRRLESQMRSLSPTANGRIQAAIEAMDGTLQNGNTGNYALAESNSDLAGRLLRQAESAAQQSQQKRKNRGRRRRVTGDNYYGQSIVGGDIEIKREYQVDRRYREDILDEVQESSFDDDNRALLENYLREIVR